jgi:hypothetical protein
MPSRLQAVFWLDATLLLSVCALETVPFTGLILHEWLDLAFIAMMLATCCFRGPGSLRARAA